VEGNEGGVGRLEKGLGLGSFLVLAKLKPLKLKPKQNLGL